MTRLHAAACCLCAAAALAAGCGSTHSAQTTTAAAPPATSGDGSGVDNKPQDCLSAAQRKKTVSRILRDAATLRRLAAPLGTSEMGTPKLQQATNSFLIHLKTSKLDLYYQNRMIDRAASAVAFACGQCFQMLEAERPIPAMKFGHSGSCPA
jgi:hypothetical protein